MTRTLQLGLGAGESEAIVLASETSAARLILDDRKARRTAQQLGLPITGTLAVLLRAKQHGLIPNLRDVLDDLAAADFPVPERTRSADVSRCIVWSSGSENRSTICPGPCDSMSASRGKLSFRFGAIVSISKSKAATSLRFRLGDASTART